MSREPSRHVRLSCVSSLLKLPNDRTYYHDVFKLDGNQSVSLCTALLGTFSVNTDDADECQRGRVQFEDSTGRLYCRLARSWSSAWFGRKLLVTGWAYVPAPEAVDADWLARLDVFEVRDPEDPVPPQQHQALLTGRFAIDDAPVLTIAAAQSLSDLDCQQLASAWPAATPNAAINSRMPVSVAGKVISKSVLHLPPLPQPPWFMLQLAGICEDGHRDHDSVSILFYGDATCKYYYELQVDAVIWLEHLRWRYIDSQAGSSVAGSGHAVLVFTQHQSLPSRLCHVTAADVYTHIYAHADRSCAAQQTNDQYMHIRYTGVVKEVVDAALGIFRLATTQSGSADSGKRSLILSHAHDPAYRPCDSYRPGNQLAIANVHVIGPHCLAYLQEDILLAACSATSVAVVDFGEDDSSQSAPVAEEHVAFIEHAYQQRWNMLTIQRILNLYATLQRKLPDVFNLELLAMTPLDKHSDAQASTLLWSLAQRIGHPLPLKPDDQPIGRDFIDEFVTHHAGECPCLHDQMSLPYLPTMAEVTDKLRETATSSNITPAGKTRYRRRCLSQHDAQLGGAVLVGVLQGDLHGQLAIMDATSRITVLLTDDCVENTDIPPLLTCRRLPAHLVGHLWAIQHYDFVLEWSIAALHSADTDTLRVFVRFSLADAVCIAQQHIPMDVTTSPATLYCMVVEHVFPAQRSKNNATISVEGVIFEASRTGSTLQAVRRVASVSKSRIPPARNYPTERPVATSQVQRCILQLQEPTDLYWAPAFQPGGVYLLYGAEPPTPMAPTKKTRQDSQSTKHMADMSNQLPVTYLTGSSSFRVASLQISNSTSLPATLSQLTCAQPQLAITDLRGTSLSGTILHADESAIAALEALQDYFSLTPLCTAQQLLVSIGLPEERTRAGRFNDASYLPDLYSFTGVVQRCEVSGEQWGSSFSAGGNALLLCITDQIDHPLHWIRLYIDLNDPCCDIRPCIARGSWITVRRAVCKLSNKGEPIFLAMACTDIEHSAAPTRQLDPVADSSSALSRLSELTTDGTASGSAYSTGALVAAVVEISIIKNVSLWWACIECGGLIYQEACIDGCTGTDASSRRLNGSAYCIASDGSANVILFIDDAEFVFYLLRAGRETVLQLNTTALREGKLDYQNWQRLEAIYGDGSAAVCDNDDQNALTVGKRLFYDLCQQANRACGTQRFRVTGRVLSAPIPYNDNRCISVKRPSMPDSKFLHSNMLHKEQRIHTLTQSMPSLRVLRVEPLTACLEVQRILQQLSTSCTAHN